MTFRDIAQALSFDPSQEDLSFKFDISVENIADCQGRRDRVGSIITLNPFK